MMLGWTLPTFARLFSILIENAAFHSGIGKGQLQLPGEAVRENNRLNVKLRNALAADINLEKVEVTAAKINKTFNMEAATAAIGDEGGSGYPKIFKLLTYDLSREHQLNVRVTPEREFEVEMNIDARGVVL